jgi:hypothetical protein
MEEELFMPCNRMRDLLLARENNDADFDSCPKLSPEAIDEMLIGQSQVALRDGLSAEDILRLGYAWIDLWDLARCTTFVWMGPDTVIGGDPPNGKSRALLKMLGFEEVLVFRESNKLPLWMQSRPSTVRVATLCEPLFRMTHASDKCTTQLTFRDATLVSSLALSELLTRCTNLSHIEFSKLCILTTEHLRVLRAACCPTRDRTLLLYWDTISRADPDIVTDFLRNCPWKLHLRCGPLGINTLSNTLVGKTSVHQLFCLDSKTDLPYDLSCLFRTLAKNKNLVNLDLSFVSISDANWSILCRSLARHPTLKYLGLNRTMPNDDDRQSKSRKARRAKGILEMLQENTVLERLLFSQDECDNRITSKLIRPYLRYRPLFSSLMKSSDPASPQLLAKALKRVSDNPELLAMLFWNNSEILRALMPDVRVV